MNIIQKLNSSYAIQFDTTVAALDRAGTLVNVEIGEFTTYEATLSYRVLNKDATVPGVLTTRTLLEAVR